MEELWPDSMDKPSFCGDFKIICPLIHPAFIRTPECVRCDKDSENGKKN